MSGKDARSTLHAICTQDILSLKDTPREAALLDKAAKILVIFYVYPTAEESTLFLLVPKKFLDILVEKIEAVQFTEEFSLTPLHAEATYAWIPPIKAPTKAIVETPEVKSSSNKDKKGENSANEEPSNEEHLLSARPFPRSFRQWNWPPHSPSKKSSKVVLLSSPYSSKAYSGKEWLLLRQQQIPIHKLTNKPTDKSNKHVYYAAEDWHLKRRQNGKLLFSAEIHEGDSALYHPEPRAIIDAKKGCYPGQEIIARSESRGRDPLYRYVTLRLREPNHALIKATLPQNIPTPSVPVADSSSIPLKNATRSIGEFRSAPFALTQRPSPTKKSLADPSFSPPPVPASSHPQDLEIPASYAIIALLHKDYYLPHTEVSFIYGEKVWEAQTLPLSRQQQEAGTHVSQTLSSHPRMKAGLQAYHRGDYAAAKESFESLQESYGVTSESLEPLAVIAERENRHDDAIRLNKELKALTPQAIMPYANLSRLYMLRGWIEEAEAEQNQARMISMKDASREATQKREDAELRAVAAKRRKQQLALFTQALALDPHDIIALFSLGKMAHEDNDPRKAKDYLEKAVKADPTHSMAWFLYGQSLIQLDEREKAQGVLGEGIRVAERQGNFAPLRAMEEALRKIS